MTTAAAAAVPQGRVLHNADHRLQAVLNANGTVRHWRFGGLSLNLFPGTELEAGPANLWLRQHPADGGAPLCTPLLGPASPGRLQAGCPREEAARATVLGQGHGLAWRLTLQLAADEPVWFWHLALHNRGTQPLSLDLLHLQDVALAPWDAVRLNEAYVSQYIDHQPLFDDGDDSHGGHGWLLASRQNQPVAGRSPWLLCGSLGRAGAWATDALQTAGLALRAGQRQGLLAQGLPGQRLQAEHSLAALQDARFTLAPGQTVQRGFFCGVLADHPAASGPDDLALARRWRALPEATPPQAEPDHWPAVAPGADDPRTLYADAPLWPSQAASTAHLADWFGSPEAAWRQVERDADGRLLSYFHGPADAPAHVVLPAKEAQVLRPHGHLLRSGRHGVPDEGSLASTVWMSGLFHSSLTQGHASANRLLSTQRGHLGQFRGQGLRVFVDVGQGWTLLDQPSAWQCTPLGATWVYQAGGQRVVVASQADADQHRMALTLTVAQGPALSVLLVLHSALQGDDGLVPADAPAAERRVHWRRHGDKHLQLWPAAGSAMAQRFGRGGLQIDLAGDAVGAAVLGDEALFADGRSRGQPLLCLRIAAARTLGLTLAGALIDTPPRTAAPTPGAAGPTLDLPALHWHWPAAAGAAGAQALAEWLPWLGHNALVHYLSPRGLEQFSGGGWGTRDVCQGPAELLQAIGRFDLLRDLLCRVFSAQNADGDWPQWFMFYRRDAHIRAGDSHGDIVFWPLVALADYLRATGDATLLDEVLPFHAADAATAERAPLHQHLDRALAVVRARTISGTALAAYGHGDWNDALQPADPALREHLCSAWTVTLHHQALHLLARALQALGQAGRAAELQAWATRVLADFQRLLVVDAVLTGYAEFDPQDAPPGAPPRLLLHPRDQRTGITYSALAMVHAIVDELFTPEQAAAHVALIRGSLLGPDGLRLFDQPLRYRGGLMTLFQRGESAAYFGREIGLMYTHAHLRWAEALARLGDGEGLLAALRLANPIALQAALPQAALRQANCYHSSSDAAFADRAQASAEYGRVAAGDIAFEGGWRVYSSGAGIAWRLVLQCLLGLVQQPLQLGIDPVLPSALDGLQVTLPLYGHAVTVVYAVGPRGHGPQQVLLGGRPLALRTGHNRYRTPGVWVDAAEVCAALQAGARQLVVRLG